MNDNVNNANKEEMNNTKIGKPMKENKKEDKKTESKITDDKNRIIRGGDFIEMDFTGYIKESNEVFDTTLAEVAKKNNFYNEKEEYRPVIIAVGKGQVVKGLDDFIMGKTPGEYSVNVKPEEAFGMRSAKLLKLMPKSTFKKHNIDPFPGLRVNIDDVMATIVNVSGSRILVDFNHPLAGKEIVYKINIKGFIDDKKKQIGSVVKKLIGKEPLVEKKEGKFVVSFDKESENDKKIIKSLSKEIIKEVKEETSEDIEIMA